MGFSCRNAGPCGAEILKGREGNKNAGRRKQTCNLGPSAIFTGVNVFQQNYHNNQLVVTPNEMVGLYCRD